MKRPSFQFYPADWRNSANLRRCSWGARGVWVEVIGLMHDSDHYGQLRWSLKEIAQALGCPLALVKELASKEVMKGCDSGRCTPLVYVPRSGRKDGEPVTLLQEQNGPIWYSSRMIKDEYVRTIRGESSRFGDANNDSPNSPPNSPPKNSLIHSPKPPIGECIGEGQGDGSTSSSSVNPPISPQGAKPSVEFKTFLADCKTRGEKAIADYRPVFDYAEKVGLPVDFVQLAWYEFSRQFGAGGVKESHRQRDWRKTFRNYVEKGYLKLWWLSGEHFELTTAGRQAERANAERMAA